MNAIDTETHARPDMNAACRHARRALRLAAAALLVLTLGLSTAVIAADAPPAKSALSSMLGDLWARLRAASPRSGSSSATAMATMTAGVRGSEATESELRPYWKGDREQDPNFRAQRDALQAAQDLADAGKFADAARAFDAFLQAYPGSPLAPDARFGSALAQAALGNKPGAVAGFETFLKQNAQHPLAKDAETALAALR